MRIYRREDAGPWWVDFWHGGRRVRRSSGTEDREKAKEWGERLKGDLWRLDRLGERPAVLWETAVLDWLEAHQHLRALSDRKDQLRWASKHLTGKPIAAIDRTMLDELGRKKAKDGVSGATVNRHLAAISAVLGYAVTRGWLDTKPKIPKRQEAEDGFCWATEKQAEKLVAGLPDHLAPMAEFALATGLRQANVTHLEWDRVDLKRAIAWIEAADAKGKRTIAVPLSDAAVAILRGQKGRHRRWVFPYRGKPIDNPAQAAYKRAVKQAGLPKAFDWHALRHTWASWHVQRGTPLAVLQELGGWASITMVQRYAHLGPSHLAAYAGNSGVVRNRAQARKTERPRKAAA